MIKKKIALTGHTRGIGKAVVDLLASEYEIIGFSRSNGYDISKKGDLEKIILQSLDCEIFINNAYHYNQQLELSRLWELSHKDSPHFIINVSTLASDPMFNVEKNLPHLVEYAREKQRLNQMTFDICDRRNGRCKAMSILLGIVETGFQNPYGIDPTNLLEHYEDFKDRGILIDPKDVAKSIKIMIDSIENNCFIYSLSLLNRF